MPTSPFGNDAGGGRAQWPGLLPEFVPGSLLPLVYNRSRLARLDPADERPGFVDVLEGANEQTVTGEEAEGREKRRGGEGPIQISLELCQNT